MRNNIVLSQKDDTFSDKNGGRISTRNTYR